MSIEIRPLSGAVGAEIFGVDIAAGLSDAQFAAIEGAYGEHGVIFFRDQTLTPEQHIAFARRFGEIEEHPFIPSAENAPEVVRFEKGKDVPGVENIWHSDVSWREVPSLGSVLRAIEVPDIGGDTLFSDMVAAYRCLDDATRDRIDGLQAVHDFTLSFGLMLDAETLDFVARVRLPVRVPVGFHSHWVPGEEVS